ncbi:unnamed protein product [Choristocarpus tenellus]
MHVVSMYSRMGQDNWVELILFIQLTCKTAHNATIQETPFFVTGHRQLLPIDMTLGVPEAIPV